MGMTELAGRAQGNDYAYIWFLGMYWSASTMFSGASWITPENLLEAVFCQLFVVFGALFITFLVSDLSSNLIKFQMARQDHRTKLEKLRKFINQHHIDPLLGLSVRKQAVERMLDQQYIFMADVAVLSTLSTFLRLELDHAISL